jgi:hypothetical protein
MAVQFQSAETTTGVESYTGSGNVVATKPTGLSVGDVMIVWIVNYAQSPAGISSPAGWTQVYSSGHANLAAKAYSKRADSSDVAASNFTFPVSGGTGFIYATGAIYRITGVSPSAIIDVQNATSFNSGSVNVDCSVTPTVANDLLLMLIAANGSSNTKGINYTNHAIQNNNPSWTEDFTSAIVSSGDQYGISNGAHATRAETTATGNISFSVSVTGDQPNLNYVVLLAIKNTLDSSVTLDVASLSASAITPTVTGGMTATLDVASIISSAIDFLFAGQAKWSAAGKNASVFTSQAKSRTQKIY